MKLFNKLFTKPKKTAVEFCQKNLDRFLTEEDFPAYNSFLTQKNINYKEYECQSRCEECKVAPYAIVNGQFISAQNANELLARLKNISES